MLSYNINTAVEYLPYVFMAIIGIAFVLLEIKTVKSIIGEGGFGREVLSGGFLPPADGYQYPVKSGVSCYIRPKGNGLYRVYHLKGDAPKVALKKDRYGQYFSIKASNDAAAESIIEKAYREGGR